MGGAGGAALVAAAYVVAYVCSHSWPIDSESDGLQHGSGPNVP